MILFTGKYTIRLANSGQIQSGEKAIYRHDVSTKNVLPLKSDSVNLHTFYAFSYLRNRTAWTVSKDMTLLRLMFILDQDGHCRACIDFRQHGRCYFILPLLLDIVTAWSCKWIIIPPFQSTEQGWLRQQAADAMATCTTGQLLFGGRTFQWGSSVHCHTTIYLSR